MSVLVPAAIVSYLSLCASLACVAHRVRWGEWNHKAEQK